MMDSFMRPQVFMLLFCWGSVSSLSVVKGSVGGNVILPCIYNDTLLQEVNVFWRDKNTSNGVIDITKGEEDVKYQTYKGRVSSFPKEYTRGNFSIILKKLQQNDFRTYECNIADVDVRRDIELVSGAAGTNVLHVVLLLVLTLLLCF